MTENTNALAQQLREMGTLGDYKRQGEWFCEVTRSTIEVIETVPQRAPVWAKDQKAGAEKHGTQYSITLKNPRGSFVFDFWGSIRDAEMVTLAEDVKKRSTTQSPEFFKVQDFLKENSKDFKKITSFLMLRNLVDQVREAIKPNAYDVLTCLHPMSEDNFADWCSSLGYDDDSISAERIYKACVEQDRNMRRLFTHDELEALQEIA